jgi:hypothetical protein
LVSFDFFLTGVELVAVAGEKAVTVRLRVKEEAVTVAPLAKLKAGDIARVKE